MNSFLFKEHSDSDKLVVSFGGRGKAFGKMSPFEFVKTFERILPDTNQLFLVDNHDSWYHNGVSGETEDIDSTVSFLQQKIQGYNEVVFLGNSSGGYASILFGSVLEVNKVIAITPQTILDFNMCESYVGKYKDVIPHMNDTTDYHIVGDVSINNHMDFHHQRHCNRMEGIDNVDVKYFEGLDLKDMRDRNELDPFLLSYF